jgi:phosphocarrier protein
MIIVAVKKTVQIKNKTGLHARPAALFVKKAGEFKSEINVIFEDKEVNAKSVMGVMSLGASKGKEIMIQAEGEDSQEAVNQLVSFVENEMPKENEE